MVVTCCVFFPLFSFKALFAELLGIDHFINIMMFFLRSHGIPTPSDENVTVIDTTFDNVPVRIYIPKRKSEALRRGLFYIHGGGWCIGRAGMFPLLKILVYHIAHILLRYSFQHIW